jgi:hypothetical protein
VCSPCPESFPRRNLDCLDVKIHSREGANSAARPRSRRLWQAMRGGQSCPQPVFRPA